MGALANIEAASDAELEVRVQAFERYFRDWELLETLLHEGTPRLTKLMIKKYSTQLGLGRLLSLLSHSDKDVRLATIEALEDYNDVTGLRLVIAA